MAQDKSGGMSQNTPVNAKKNPVATPVPGATKTVIAPVKTSASQGRYTPAQASQRVTSRPVAANPNKDKTDVQIQRAEQLAERQALITNSPITGAGNDTSAQQLAIEQAKSNEVKQLNTTGVNAGKETSATVAAPITTVTPVTPVTESSKIGTDAITIVNNKYNEIINNKFEYDPLTDKDYLSNASALENQISQMMVGRGGLYSSVSTNAISSGMIQLQIGAIKEKYAEYKDDRNFKLSLAQSEFNNSMAIASFRDKQEQATIDNKARELQFKAQQEERAFNKQMAIQNNNLRIAEYNYNKSVQDAKAKQSIAISQFQSQAAVWKDSRTSLDRAVADWTRNKTASPFVVSTMDAFGYKIPLGTDISKFQNAIASAYNRSALAEDRLKDKAIELGMASDAFAMIDAIKNVPVQYETVSTTRKLPDGSTQTTSFKQDRNK